MSQYEFWLQNAHSQASQALYYDPLAFARESQPPTPDVVVPSTPVPSTPVPATPVQPVQAIVAEQPPPAARSQARGQNARWTLAEQRLLGELLLEDKATSTAQGGCKPVVWNAIAAKINALNSSGGLKDAKKCSNQRQYLLDNYWDPIHKLLQLSGFGWDEDLHMVTAPEEVWKAYIEAHPQMEKWQTTSWELYPLYDELFQGTRATGKNVVRPTDRYNGRKRASDDSDEDDIGEEDVTDASQDTHATPLRSGSKARTPAVTPGSSKSRKVSGPESISTMASTLAEHNAISEAKLEWTRSQSPGFAFGKAIGHLKRVEYLDQSDKVAVINALTADPRKVDALLGVVGDDIEEVLVRSWL